MNFWKKEPLNWYGLFYTGGKIVFLPNGKEIIFSTGNKISKIDIFGKKIETFRVSSRSVILSLDIDKGGNFLLTIDSTNLVEMIDLKKKESRGKIIMKSSCYIIKWSPRRKYFSVVLANHIQVWKISPHLISKTSPFQLLRTYNCHYDPIWDIDWDPTGEFLISGGHDKIVRVFSFRKKNKFVEVHFKNFKEEVISVKFYKNWNRFLTLTKKGYLTLWFFLQKKIRSCQNFFVKKLKLKNMSNFKIPVKNKKITAVFFNFTSENIFIGLIDGKILVYDLSKILSTKFNKKKKFSRLEKLYSIQSYSFLNSPISSLSGSSNSSLIAIGKFKSGNVMIFDQLSKKILINYGDSKNSFCCCDISPNNQVICTGNQDGSVNIWSKNSGFCLLKFFNHTREINGIIFLKNNSRAIISSSSDGSLKIFDLRKSIVSQTFFLPGSSNNFDLLASDDSGFFIACSCKQTFFIYIWSLKKGNLIESLEGHVSKIYKIAFLENRINLLSGSSDQTVRIWNLENLTTPAACSCDIFNLHEKISRVTIHPTKTEVAIFSESGFLHFFDFKEFSSFGCFFKTPQKIYKRNNDQKNKIVVDSICYSNEGKFFLISFSSRLIRLFYRSSFKSAGIVKIPRIDFISEMSDSRPREYNKLKILDLRFLKNSHQFLVLWNFFFFFFPVTTSIRPNVKLLSFFLKKPPKHLWEKTLKWGVFREQIFLLNKILSSFFTFFSHLLEQIEGFIIPLLSNLKIWQNSDIFFFFRVFSKKKNELSKSIFFFYLLKKFEEIRKEIQGKFELIISIISLEINF